MEKELILSKILEIGEEMLVSGGYVEVYAEQGYWSGQYAAAPGWS